MYLGPRDEALFELLAAEAPGVLVLQEVYLDRDSAANLKRRLNSRGYHFITGNFTLTPLDRRS